MNKPTKVISAIALTLALSLTAVEGVDASTDGRVMWGKTELKVGQIGKVTILKDTNLVILNNDGSLTTVRKLKKGDEFRVYQYKGQHNGLYGVGSSSFVQKDTSKVLYETPSKSKLDIVNNINPTPSKPVTPVKPPVVKGELKEKIPNTLKHMENNNIVIKGSELNNVTVKIEDYFGMVAMGKTSGNPTLIINPLYASGENYEDYNKKASKLISVYFTEMGYPVTDAKVKSLIDTFITTGLKNGDTKVTGDLYVKRSSGLMSFFTK